MRDRLAKPAALAVAGGLFVVALASGCSMGPSSANLVNGKKEFIAKCGACHVLNRAGTTGVTGPDLDEAFARSVEDGFGRSAIEGVVHGQILEPSSRPQVDPVTGEKTAMMPAKLVTGDDARDVAAYVAYAAAKKGKDMGALAAVGIKKSNATAKERGGTLTIPADPSGALQYVFSTATASSGEITVKSPNKSSVDHDIAIEGQGVSAKGEVVKNGGVSELSANLKPGTYTFYCTVPGHRQAGMVGKLTVK